MTEAHCSDVVGFYNSLDCSWEGKDGPSLK